jgi:hypothetical protein
MIAPFTSRPLSNYTATSSKLKTFVERKFNYKSCQYQDDLVENPVYKALLITAVIFLGFLNITILIFFCMYRKFKA